MSVSETIQEVLQSLVDFSAPMDTCAQGARIPTYLCLEGGTPVTEKDFKTFFDEPEEQYFSSRRIRSFLLNQQ